MFRALCAHHQKVKIVLYSIWYHHTCRWPSGAQFERRLSSSLNLRHLTDGTENNIKSVDSTELDQGIVERSDL